MPRLATPRPPCARSVPAAPRRSPGRPSFPGCKSQGGQGRALQQGAHPRHGASTRSRAALDSPSPSPSPSSALSSSPSSSSYSFPPECSRKPASPGSGPGAAWPQPSAARHSPPPQACRLGPRRDSVLVPRDRHLSCSKGHLKEALLRRYFPGEGEGGAAAAEFLRLTSLCEAVLQAQALPLLEQLRSDWAAQAETAPGSSRGGGAGGDSEEYSGGGLSLADSWGTAGGDGGGDSGATLGGCAGGERLERSLVSLLQRSQFVAIAACDMALAEQLAADSVLTLPIAVPRPEEGGGRGAPSGHAPPSIMLFRRGFSVERQQGRLLGAKFDFVQAVLLRATLSALLAPLEGAVAAVSVAGLALGKTLGNQIQEGAQALGGTLEEARGSLLGSIRGQAQGKEQEQAQAQEEAQGQAQGQAQASDSDAVPEEHLAAAAVDRERERHCQGGRGEDSPTGSDGSTHGHFDLDSDNGGVSYSDREGNSAGSPDERESPHQDWRAQYQPFWSPDSHACDNGRAARKGHQSSNHREKHSDTHSDRGVGGFSDGRGLVASGASQQRERRSLFERALSSAGYRWALVSSLRKALRVLPRVAEAVEGEPGAGAPAAAAPRRDSPGAERIADHDHHPSRSLRRRRMEDLWSDGGQQGGPGEGRIAPRSRPAGGAPGRKDAQEERGGSTGARSGEGVTRGDGGESAASIFSAQPGGDLTGKLGQMISSLEGSLGPGPGSAAGDVPEGASGAEEKSPSSATGTPSAPSAKRRQPPVVLREEDPREEGADTGAAKEGPLGAREEEEERQGWPQVEALQDLSLQDLPLQDLSAAAERAERQLEEVSRAAAGAQREAQRQLQELSLAAEQVQSGVKRRVTVAQWVVRRLDGPRRRVCQKLDAWTAPARSAVSTFFSPSVLEDPAHEQVVVIQSTPVAAQAPGGASMRAQSLAMWKRLLGVPSEAQRGAASEGTAGRRVTVTVYKSIPLPLIKMVFPNKRLTFRPLDMIRLDITTLIGLLAYFVNYRFEDALSSPSALVLDLVSTVALLLFAGRASLGYLQTWNRYQLLLNAELNAKTVAVSFPAVLTILDSCVQQQVLEAILCIAVLHGHQRSAGGEPMVAQTPTKLKAACEAFMAEDMGMEVDFPIDESLALLLRLQIVTIDEGPTDANHESEHPLLHSEPGLRLVPSPIPVLQRDVVKAVTGIGEEDTSVGNH